MGPNDASRVVWALGEFFNFFFVFFIYLTIYIGTTKYGMVQHKQQRRQRAQGDLNHDNDSKHGDELGEIAVTDKTDFTLSSGGQLCCLTDLSLLCFAFTSFIFFFF